MEITFQGKSAIIRKERFYCKSGAYEHKSKTGWVVEVEGRIVLGGRLQTNNTCHGAARTEYPEYKTRKSLLEDVEYYNGIHERRKKK